MSLFTITCTTCKSRLTVRDQAAIGQILACPKCGGMVMVKPPPAFHEASDQRSDVPTATELSSPAGPRFDQTLDSSAFDVVDELLSDAPPKMQRPLPSATPAPAAAPASPKPRFVGGPKATKAAAPPAEASPVPPPPQQPAKPAAAAPAAPASRHARRRWLLMAASIGLGVTLAFGAVTATVLTLRGSRGPVNQARPSATNQPRETTEPALTNTAPTETALPQPPAEPLAAETPPPPPAETTESIQPASTVEATNSVAASPAPTTDPIGIVPPPAAVPAASAPPKSGLARFDNLLGGGADDPLAQPTAAPPPSPPLPESAAGPARPLAPRPPPREVDVAKRLADPLLGIETAGTPLADFVQLFSDLSTIPITLDLPLTPATAESPVVLKLGSTTVGTALTEALKPLRLEYVAADDQLLIRRLEPENIESLRRSVKDLTGGDPAQLEKLAHLLRTTVEPSAWGEESGGSLEIDAAKSQLIIKQNRAIQFQVLLALEKLRAARRPPLPPQLQLDPALFAATTRYSRAAANLEKTVSFNFSQPTRLLTILDRLTEATGVRIVVDWRDAASLGWNPAAEAQLLVADKPLSEALDALLDPLDLAWRVIDAKTVQVVTPARLLSQGEFEIYPVASLTGGSTSAALLERLEAALAKALTEQAGGAIAYDERTQSILAWLPQPHQQALELLLTQWQSEAVK